MIIIGIIFILFCLVSTVIAYAISKKKIFRVFIFIFIPALIAGIAFVAGSISNALPTGNEGADYALSKTGLAERDNITFSLRGTTGWRAYVDITEFVVPDYDDEREELFEEIKTVGGWHVAEVPLAEYEQFVSEAMWSQGPGIIMLPDDTVFDAWYYEETCEAPTYYVNIKTEAFREKRWQRS